MNVLFVNSITMWGGAEVWFLRVMEGLAERGHAVHLACRAETPLAAEASRRGLAVHEIPIRGDLDPGSIAALHGLMRRLRIDVAIANREKELRIAGVAGKLAGAVPVIARRAVGEPVKNTWRARITWNHLARHILVNAEMTRRTLLRSAPWLDPERITLVYNGIDPARAGRGDRAALRRRHAIPECAPVAGFVGQLIPRKGIRYLADGFRIVHADVSDARLLVVGTGPLASELEALRAEPGMGDAVVMAGFREDAADYMTAIDVLVLPALEEGLANVLIEAMAAGTAVVAADTSSMPEAVTSGVEGLLVPPRDGAALGAAVIPLLRDPARRRAMGEAGRARVARQFTRERMLDELEALLRRVVSAGDTVR